MNVEGMVVGDGKVASATTYLVLGKLLSESKRKVSTST